MVACGEAHFALNEQVGCGDPSDPGEAQRWSVPNRGSVVCQGDLRLVWCPQQIAKKAGGLGVSNKGTSVRCVPRWLEKGLNPP